MICRTTSLDRLLLSEYQHHYKMAAPVREVMLSLAKNWCNSLKSLRIVIDTYMRNGPPPSLAILGNCSISPCQHEKQNFPTSSDLNSIFGGVLLAVQRSRRTAERKLKRKHSFTGHYEHAMPKTNIVPCLECGNFKEKGHLCQHCYEKVKTETKQMQEKMGDDLSFQVPNKETIFVYEGESAPGDGKFVVDMEKPRPSWFPRKLLNKTG